MTTHEQANCTLKFPSCQSYAGGDAEFEVTLDEGFLRSLDLRRTVALRGVHLDYRNRPELFERHLTRFGTVRLFLFVSTGLAIVMFDRAEKVAVLRQRHTKLMLCPEANVEVQIGTVEYRLPRKASKEESVKKTFALINADYQSTPASSSATKKTAAITAPGTGPSGFSDQQDSQKHGPHSEAWEKWKEEIRAGSPRYDRDGRPKSDFLGFLDGLFSTDFTTARENDEISRAPQRPRSSLLRFKDFVLKQRHNPIICGILVAVYYLLVCQNSAPKELTTAPFMVLTLALACQWVVVGRHRHTRFHGLLSRCLILVALVFPTLFAVAILNGEQAAGLYLCASVSVAALYFPVLKSLWKDDKKKTLSSYLFAYFGIALVILNVGVHTGILHWPWLVLGLQCRTLLLGALLAYNLLLAIWLTRRLKVKRGLPKALRQFFAEVIEASKKDSKRHGLMHRSAESGVGLYQIIWYLFRWSYRIVVRFKNIVRQFYDNIKTFLEDYSRAGLAICIEAFLVCPLIFICCFKLEESFSAFAIGAFLVRPDFLQGCLTVVWILCTTGTAWVAWSLLYVIEQNSLAKTKPEDADGEVRPRSNAANLKVSRIFMIDGLGSVLTVFAVASMVIWLGRNTRIWIAGNFDSHTFFAADLFAAIGFMLMVRYTPAWHISRVVCRELLKTVRRRLSRPRLIAGGIRRLPPEND